MATKKTAKTAVKKTTRSSRTADAKAGPKKPAAATKPPAGKLPAAIRNEPAIGVPPDASDEQKEASSRFQ